jgi:hypothetical protein
MLTETLVGGLEEESKKKESLKNPFITSTAEAELIKTFTLVI